MVRRGGAALAAAGLPGSQPLLIVPLLGSMPRGPAVLGKGVGLMGQLVVEKHEGVLCSSFVPMILNCELGEFEIEMNFD